MSSLYENIFGPLDKQYCVYFLFLTGFSFFVLVVYILAHILFIFTHFNKINPQTIVIRLYILFNICITYFVNRLLYTMCSKSLL